MAQIVKTLTIVQHNVCHWTTRKNSLSNTYYDINPEIILLNSHGLKATEQLKLFNYNTHKCNKTNERNDGIAIAIKRNIKYKLLDNFNDDIMAIKIQTSLGEVIVATTYLPPRRPILPIAEFLKLLNYNLPIYIIGDFNARHRIFGNNDQNPIGETLNTFINTGKLIHLGPNFKTYIGIRTLTNPDKIFCNNKHYLNHVSLPGPLTTSDHTPIIFKLSTSPIQIPTTPRFRMGKANWDGFQNELLNNSTTELDQCTLEEIDNTIEKLHNDMKKAANNNIPKTLYKTLPHFKSSNDLKTIQAIYAQTINYIDTFGPNINLINNVKILQDNIQEICANKFQEKWEHIINRINEDKNPKTFWASINKLCGTNKQKQPYILDQNGRKLYEDEEIEEAFRKQWKNIFKISEEENEEFDEETEELVVDYLNNNNDRYTPHHTANFERLTPGLIITEGEAYHHLRKMKEKTPGMTGLTRNMIINLPSNSFQTLLNIYNASLSAGYFPDVFKIAKLIFIPKAEKDPKQIINYRPISLLEVTGKLFEKIINNRIRKLYEANNVYNPRQHGFRDERGTQTAIAMTTEIIAIEISKGNQVNLIQRDISKAFDKIWTNGLKYRILNSQLPNVYERLLCDFLDDRVAHVNIGQFTGPAIPLLSGVPQGSSLSPTLFSLYTSNAPEPTQFSEYIMYADDVTQIISYPGKSTQMMARHTARAIESMNKYEKQWKIKTNNNKFKILPIAKYKPSPLIVNEEVLPFTSEINILGLTITKQGYKKFITEKGNKAKAISAKLKRFRNLKASIKKKLYTTLERPIIEYPVVPLYSLSKSNIKKLQILQNKELRYIYDIKYTDHITNEELHKRANLETINVLLYNRTKKLWNKLHEMRMETYERWIKNEITPKEHGWFPRSKTKIEGRPPDPKY